MKHSRRIRFSLIPLLLFSFFFVQSSCIPTPVFASPPNAPHDASPRPLAEAKDLRDPSRPLAAQDDARRHIEHQLGLRIQESGDVYILTDVNDADFLQVVEKLPNGGFGRMLRYRGWNEHAESVDMEFIYEDHVNQVTILDYAAGRFYRTTFTEKRADPLSVSPRKQDRSLTPEFTATQSSPPKFLFGKQSFIGAALPRINWLHSQFEALSEQDIWTNRHVRGPPLGGLTP